MYVAWLKDLRMADLAQVGGKNASLGEMIGGLSAAGVQVPGGYATTAPLIMANIAQLGFDIRDVKVLLNSNANVDNAGALAVSATGVTARGVAVAAVTS